MKKVVHLTTVHHPYDPRIFHKECTSLAKAGFDVTLLAKESPTGSVDYNNGVKHEKIKTRKSRISRMLLSTFEVFRKAKAKKADVYHFHDPELLIVGWLLKRKDNVVIYDIHEDYVTSILQKQYLPKPLRYLIAKLYTFIEKKLTKGMELCLAEKYYKEKYTSGTCILNYPILNSLPQKNNDLTKEKTNALIYTGNVTLDRGALIHANLPKINPELEVHYVGKCSSELAEEIRLTSLPHENQIKIEGVNTFIKKERIEERYNERNWLAGLALFPPTDHYMKKELTKFFEYMNEGIPILCSNFPVWEHFIEKHKCGIAVDPYDKEEVGKAIEYLREHPEQAHKMGEKGRQAVLNELNWNQEEAKLIKWYNELV